MTPRTDKTGRSKGEPRHIRLYHYFMNTEAWRSLDATARALYVEIVARYAGPGSNNGRLPYSLREAEAALGIGQSTAKRAFDALQDRGFIVATKKGAFSLKIRHATEWRLTEFPCDVTHVLASKEFTRWSAEIQNTASRSAPTASIAAPIDTYSGTAPHKKHAHGI
jgi:DNA-binding transcriptional MocR family regulator